MKNGKNVKKVDSDVTYAEKTGLVLFLKDFANFTW